MITYLSPHEAAMAIEVPLVLVWQARIHAVQTHQCGRFNYSSDRRYVDVPGQRLVFLCEVLPLLLALCI